MHVTRVETRVVMLKLKYGMEIGDTVDTLIRKLIEGKEDFTPLEEKHKEAATKLRVALVTAGFLPGEDEAVEEVTAEGESEAKKVRLCCRCTRAPRESFVCVPRALSPLAAHNLCGALTKAHKAKNAARRAAAESAKATAKTVAEKFAAFAGGKGTMTYEQLDKFIQAHASLFAPRKPYAEVACCGVSGGV